jgi:hypothetical protein
MKSKNSDEEGKREKARKEEREKARKGEKKNREFEIRVSRIFLFTIFVFVKKPPIRLYRRLPS